LERGEGALPKHVELENENGGALKEEKKGWRKVETAAFAPEGKEDERG